MEMRNPYDPKKSVKSIGDVSKNHGKRGVQAVEIDGNWT